MLPCSISCFSSACAHGVPACPASRPLILAMPADPAPSAGQSRILRLYSLLGEPHHLASGRVDNAPASRLALFRQLWSEASSQQARFYPDAS